VALTTSHLEPTAGDKTLEIAADASYQALVLAELGLEVYSIAGHIGLA
jgi:protein-L-isoaspartate O-methyltransferase